MRLVVAALLSLLLLPEAGAQHRPAHVSVEFVEALLSVMGGTTPEVFPDTAPPGVDVADALPTDAVLLGSLRAAGRGGETALVLARLSGSVGVVTEGYREAPPTGWRVEAAREHDEGTVLTLCSADDRRKLEVRLIPRADGGSTAAVAEGRLDCGPVTAERYGPPPPAPPPPPDPVAVFRLPRLSAPPGVERLSLREDRGRPTVLRLGEGATVGTVADHLGRVFEADGWTPLVRTEAGGDAVSTWSRSRRGFETAVVTLVIREERAGVVRATATRID